MSAPATISEPRHVALTEPDSAPAALFARWRDLIASVFEVAADPGEVSHFTGQLEIHATAHIAQSRITCSTVRLRRSPDTILRGRADHFVLWLVRQGSLSGFAGQTKIDCSPGDVLLLDLQQTVDLQTSTRGEVTESLVLWVPRARMLASIPDDHALHGLVLHGHAGAAALIGASLAALAASSSLVTEAEMDALAGGVIELAARALAPILAAAARDSVSLASFLTIRRFIDRNLTSPELGPELLCQQFGLSRSTLYRLFEPAGGVAGYIRRQRLHRAFQEVVATGYSNQRIGLIGYRLGFRNTSDFTRTFRQSFGMSPSEARREAQAGNHPPPVETGQTQGPTTLAGILSQTCAAGAQTRDFSDPKMKFVSRIVL